MKSILETIDWLPLLRILWSAVFLPLLTLLGKQLYEFMRWGFFSMGSDGGKDYFISKDSTDFIYIRDMYTINPTYDYYFVNFRETSPEEIKYFYASPSKRLPFNPRELKADREMLQRMAFRTAKLNNNPK